jgi:hypothetical protein
LAAARAIADDGLAGIPAGRRLRDVAACEVAAAARRSFDVARGYEGSSPGRAGRLSISARPASHLAFAISSRFSSSDLPASRGFSTRGRLEGRLGYGPAGVVPLMRTG